MLSYKGEIKLKIVNRETDSKERVVWEKESERDLEKKREIER